MPVQLTLRSPKGGRVLAERDYADGYRIDAVSGWLVVVDRNGSVVAAHAACPGLEAAVVEYTSTAGRVDCPGCTGDPADHPHATASVEELPAGEVEFPDGRRSSVLDDPPLRVADVRLPGHPIDDALLDALHAAGRTYGPLGVALAAATLTDPDVLVAHLTGPDSDPEPGPEPAARNDDEQQATLQAYRDEVEEQTARAEREHAARLATEREVDRLRVALRDCQALARHRLDEWNETREERDAARRIVAAEQQRLDAENDLLREQLRERIERQQEAEATLALYRSRGYRPSVDGRPPTSDEDPIPHEPIDLRSVDEDPRRPHPDSWPDDAVLLTYRELRRLAALHLERYLDDPMVARAMLEGDVPLRLAEVLA